MKKLKSKLIGLVVVMLIATFILPMQVLAANEDLQKQNENLQIVKTEGKYIVYVKDLNEKFKYTISESQIDTSNELALGNVISTTDEAGNHVAVITDANAKYFYLTTDKGVKEIKLDLNDSFDKTAMEEVEKTTERIPTKVIQGIVEKDGEINEEGRKITVTVGGLEIVDKEGSYKYALTKLPKEKYDDLMKLANEILQDENKFNELSMYKKIEAEKSSYTLYTKLKEEQDWKAVENYQVLQPDDAETGDQYIVFLKTADGNTVDAKFMLAEKVRKEGEAQTGTVEVKRTSKLPITGDSLILFAILAVIILIAIVVFIRMKKLEGRQSKH